MNQLIENTISLLRKAHDAHGDRLVYPCALGSEGMVQIDLICKHAPSIRIITLDTGRLPKETYDLMARIHEHYGVRIEVVFPERAGVEKMVNTHGINLFYDSVEYRKLCCNVRKVQPLQRILAGMDAWITGRRSDHSEHRASVQAVEHDPVFGLMKYNPMLDWTEKNIWAYIREHDVPYNSLHDAHYVSIGCACCTRAITVGEDIRAGRWWWENADTLTECGLHVSSLMDKTGEGIDGEGI